MLVNFITFASVIGFSRGVTLYTVATLKLNNALNAAAAQF